jgi:hypothetical protein
MMQVDWEDICANGIVPTVFINSDNGCGMILRWQFLDEEVKEPELDTLFHDFEIQNSFETVRYIVNNFFGRTPSGFRMMPADLHYIQESDIRLSGSSLGLALVVGAVAWVLNRQWPYRTLAWGAVLPIRDGGFSLYPVEDHEDKLALARLVGARTILIPQSQFGPELHGINYLRISTLMTAALQAIESMLNKEVL